MRRTCWLVLAVLICLPSITSAMGALGGDVPSSIPKPARNFIFSVTDQLGIKTELEEFNIEGLVYLSGQHGRGTLAIPFERISQIHLQVQGEKLRADAELVDGTTATLIVDGRKKCYGRMKYANFQIELRDLEKMVNHGQAAR